MKKGLKFNFWWPQWTMLLTKLTKAIIIVRYILKLQNKKSEKFLIVFQKRALEKY